MVNLDPAANKRVPNSTCKGALSKHSLGMTLNVESHNAMWRNKVVFAICTHKVSSINLLNRRHY